MLKAVIFDIDGVLVDSKEANAVLYQKLLVKAGYKEPAKERVLECFHLTLKQSLAKLTGVKDPKEIERIVDLVYSPDIKTSHLFVYPEKLEEVLEDLHKKYKLAIVTSRMKLGVKAVFEARDIKHFFDAVISFEDYDNPKPHPEPLLTALDKLGLRPDEAIYIGDGESDIRAAKDAGTKSIHLASVRHTDATAGTKEFDELIGVIESLA